MCISLLNVSTCIYMHIQELDSGILAGIWPCATITLLAELFTSESKAQVYGPVHDFCAPTQIRRVT